jgi:hypothetical protein
MPKRDWRFYATFGGLAAILIAIFAVPPLLQHYQNASRAERAAEHAYEISKRIAPFGPATDGEYANPEAHRNEWRAERDLKAQTQMAEWARWTMMISGIGLVVGVAGIFFVARTLDATREQVSLNRLAMERTERAFVFLARMHAMAGVKRDTGQVVDWTFFPVWENAGNTQTRFMYMHTNWKPFTPQIPDDFDFPDLSKEPVKRVQILLGPKATTWGGGCTVPIDTLDAARVGQCELFVWGWVEYNDIFERTPRHRTEFCVSINVAGDPRIANMPSDSESPHVPFFYPGYAKYNGADDECLKRPTTSAPK